MQVLIVVNCLIALIVLLRVIRLKNLDTLFYAFGTTCFLISVILDSVFWDVNKTDAIVVRIGLVGEVLFYSVGLGVRLKREQNEKQKVQVELIEQLRVNQELLENRESELEEMVERRTEKLRALNGELKSYDQMISHDLKGPISNIQAVAELMVNQSSNTPLLEPSKIIKKQAERSLGLIKSILDFSVTDQLSLDEVSIDLNDVLDDVLNSLNNRISNKNIQLTINHLPTLSKGVRVKIYQLFYNLISNAIKFKREGAEHNITVLTEDTKDAIQISIEDNGLGFDPEDAKKIFEPKYRSDSSTKEEGHGIGLSTCKRIAVLHGWVIEAKALTPYGARFVLTIPKSIVQS